MSRPSDVPVLSFAECVISAVMATSEDELLRCVRAGLWSDGPLMYDVSPLVPPPAFDALGRPGTFPKLIAAVRRQLTNQTTGNL